jgi:hypothetical protein
LTVRDPGRQKPPRTAETDRSEAAAEAVTRVCAAGKLMIQIAASASRAAAGARDRIVADGMANG